VNSKCTPQDAAMKLVEMLEKAGTISTLSAKPGSNGTAL
jgi:hypothetical protein